MFDENTRNAIALKRFSLISPILNGQVRNNTAYYCEITQKPIEMPYYGFRKYAPKTIETWYCEYMRGGLDALKPKPRGDKGSSRVIDEQLGEMVLEKKRMYPKAPVTVIYEMLIKEGVIDAASISLTTVYRYLKKTRVKNAVLPGEEEKDMKRFSHQYINELWQTDVMYGPYIKDGNKKYKTYLFAYLDDASRLISHAQFYFAQNFDVLRHSFKEAVLKRGIPNLIYTDNGKIYRSQQFELICAGLGCTLIHSKPYEPNGRGKIERFFLTVRRRFLSAIDPTAVKSIDEFNSMFFKWLDEDYQKKPHASLDGIAPLDYFMGQVHRLNLNLNPKEIEEKFLVKQKRKIGHDGTFSIDRLLYETKTKFAGLTVEVRYDPAWLTIPFTPILIYIDDKKVGEALQVNFHDNAHMRRRGRSPANSNDVTANITLSPSEEKPSQTISFAWMMKEVE